MTLTQSREIQAGIEKVRKLYIYGSQDLYPPCYIIQFERKLHKMTSFKEKKAFIKFTYRAIEEANCMVKPNVR